MSPVRAEKADLTDGGTLEPAQADAHSNPGSKAPPGGVFFVAAARYTEASLGFAERRFLVVSLPPGANYRSLTRAIDDAVEGALALRGALPREAPAPADVEATVRDQGIRAHALGLSGIALMFPRLSREPLGGVLGIDESAFVSAWIAAAQRGLAAVLFDEHDRELRVLAPRRLADLAPSPKTGLRVERLSASVLPPSPSARDSIPPSGRIAKAAPEGSPVTLKAGAPPSVAMPQRSVQTEPPPPSTVTPRPSALNKRVLLTALGAKLSQAEADLAAPEAGPAPTQRAPAHELLSILPAPIALGVRHGADWRAHAVELDKARGPKPVGVIERLFINRYMPLLGAISRGEADGAVRAAIHGFRTDFEHSYRGFVSSPRVHGKRPLMVSDAPDIAAWVGRHRGADAVTLLLIDAMRFDISERVVSRIHGHAMCVERILLWSAHTAITVPMPKDVMKLDLVEPRLSTGGAGYEDRIESVADEVAQITIRYMETLPPRTLLFMFGNHGFQLPCGQDGRATGAATLGGVSPEEVLVPGHAWFIGGAR